MISMLFCLGRLPLRDHDHLRLQFLGAKDAWLSCIGIDCDLRGCPSDNDNYLYFENRCSGELFQIIGEGTPNASITSGQRIRLHYLHDPNKWMGCPLGILCNKRTCPGTTIQGGDFTNNRCRGETFIIYARKRSDGDTIYNGDVVMLYFPYWDRYITIQGEYYGAGASVDFCPGMPPPAYLSYGICAKNAFRIYRKP